MNNLQPINNERGLTLIEVLTSIVILAIILVFFINLLVQSASTNRTSENIIDATYVAQSIIEEIYNVSSHNNYEDGKKIMGEELGYNLKNEVGNWDIYEKIHKEYTISIRLGEAENRLHSVIVEVYDGDDFNHPRAKMENALFWGR